MVRSSWIYIGISVVLALVVLSLPVIAVDKQPKAPIAPINTPLAASEVTIQNDYLSITVYPNGDFTGKTTSGKWIFYPGDTSDLTIKIGSDEYDIYHSSLNAFRTADTYINPNNDKEAITEWDIGYIHIEQHIKLEGKFVVFMLKLKNHGNSEKSVSVRYLLDTQLSDNDGSPLEAKGQLYTKEMCFEPVDFSYWTAYSRPEESEADLVTYCWWIDVPDRIIFAHWPHAIDTVYSYDWDPNRQFYTPGYVTSPESDSCVLMYWENITLPPGTEKKITFYYGISIQTGLSMSLRLSKTNYLPNEEMGVYVKVIDRNGNVNIPLTRENTEVKIDGHDVDIEKINILSNGEYLLKIRAPSEPGTHTIWVQVVTDEGSVSASESFNVNEISGIVEIGGLTVDKATKDWKYPTHYNAPVFRRGLDIPSFYLKLDSYPPNFLNYNVLYEVYPPNSDNPIWSSEVPPTCCPIWEWTYTNGIKMQTDEIPVGIWTVKAYLVDKSSGGKVFINSSEFYVIFNFTEDMQSFVTWDKEVDYYKIIIILRHDVYELHIYNPEIWKRAIEWVNGNKSVFEAVDSISELARRIDGKMVYHHANIDETWTFEIDEYDNNFNGIIDDRAENWNHNYEPYWGGANSPESGRAYDKSRTIEICVPYTSICWTIYYDTAWVDGKGNYYSDKLIADKIAWYFDVLDMLREDFDPENKIPEPHQHSVGVCEDYAMLTVAYLRSIGIPARVATGYLHGLGGHAWTQWYENGAWHHLDVDHITVHSDWERNKFNRYYYEYEHCPPDWVLVRNSGDLNDVSDIADQYRHHARAQRPEVSVAENTLCQYEIIGEPSFKPGENTTVLINITNPNNNSVTLNISAELITSCQPIGGKATPVALSTKQITIPANSTVTEMIDLTVSAYASPGNYTLNIYENTTLSATKNVKVLPKYNIIIDKPSTILPNKPFSYNVTIINGNYTLRNLSISLETHNYFATTESLEKHISVLNPNEIVTFSWTLIPLYSGELRIDVSASTSNAGSETKVDTVHVLSNPKLWISYSLPDKIAKGEEFTLNVYVYNSGDIKADDVTVRITTPENVTSNIASIYLGSIEPHESKSATFEIYQNEDRDFSIVISAISATTNATDYAFVNIIQPDMFVDLLTPDETIGIEQHTDAIETLADRPYNLVLYIRNSGDQILHNVRINSNVGITQNIGDIEVGGVRQIQLQFTPTTPGLGEINITVKADEIEKRVVRPILVEKFNFSLSIPKTRFSKGESVPIIISVTNEVPSIRFVGLLVKINITGVEYNKSFETPLLSIAPLETRNISITWDTANVDCGEYTIVASLYMNNRELYKEIREVIVGPPPIDDHQPMDLNEDGLFEDVNGDGQFNFGDVVFFFKNFDKDEIKNYPEYYDFNNDGLVNFGDVVALFKML